MRINISQSKLEPSSRPVEIVERKGFGHPDTLSDALGEHLSRVYSKYTLNRFGACLRAQFDKTILMCGRSRVVFGGGELLDPIRVLLNGRASVRLGDKTIPVRELLEAATHEFFRERFPMLDTHKDLRLLWEVRTGMHTTTGGVFGAPEDTASAAAAVHYRFHPRSLGDLPETHCAQSNDTSIAVAWAPYTSLERAVLLIEQTLNSSDTKKYYPWIGSDIKLLAVRRATQVSMVVAVPLISTLTPDAETYFSRLNEIDCTVRELFVSVAPDLTLSELVLNSGDDLEARKLYMNLTGSSIESGDEGMVGRGNRLGGVISSCRPFTIEALAGKNPRYNMAKLYSAAGFEIATRLHQELGISSNIYLANRMAEPLTSPWFAAVETTSARTSDLLICSVVEEVLGDLGRVTGRILDGHYPLF